MSLTDGMYKQEEGFDDNTSLEVLKKAFELGITMLNTAAFYSGGKNEELIGESFQSTLILLTQHYHLQHASIHCCKVMLMCQLSEC